MKQTLKYNTKYIEFFAVDSNLDKHLIHKSCSSYLVVFIEYTFRSTIALSIIGGIPPMAFFKRFINFTQYITLEQKVQKVLSAFFEYNEHK